ncbi:MAG TPA: acyl-CoA dehydrogenase, partial [Gammaproteobacteria bacterium]|nr:acyl-CoA dehydrogenase [Gammaproteobacteria bacterium]
MALTWIVLLTLLVVIGVIVIVGPIRRLLITGLVFRWYQKVLPPMSATEREAIDAGDTWHEADLFQGRPNWQELLALPKPTLTKAEQDFLDNQVEKFCSMIDDWQITQHDLDLPEPAWNYLKTAGFFGLHIPPEFGGLGFSALASSTVVQKVATKSSTAAVIVMVPNSLGPAELLLNYGTEQQKQQYLHKLAKGVEVPCFGLTSPVAGSDAGAIVDEGIVSYGEFNGQKVLGLRLNWNKRYITLAPIATVIGLAVKVKDPDHLLGKYAELGITVVLMPTDLPGIEIGKRHFPLNQPFMNGPTRGKDVFVPLDFVIGGAERIGHGWQMLVECLAAGRGISLPAVSTATGKHCFTTCGAYAKLRQQFGLSIGKFEGVAAALARIGGQAYMLEATRVLTLGAIDAKARPSVVTAICKYHMTEMARKVINDAMDIHGGKGVMLGPRNYLGRVYEALPISITVEGANILTRCLIIFGQGAIRCHPYIFKEMLAAMNEDKHAGLQEFDTAFSGHVCYTVGNYFKLLFHSYSSMLFCESPSSDPQWSKYYRRLSFCSLALACSTDM